MNGGDDDGDKSVVQPSGAPDEDELERPSFLRRLTGRAKHADDKSDDSKES